MPDETMNVPPLPALNLLYCQSLLFAHGSAILSAPPGCCGATKRAMCGLRKVGWLASVNRTYCEVGTPVFKWAGVPLAGVVFHGMEI